jgi:hypothetical protein
MYDDVVAVASKTNATLCDEFLLSSSVELFRQPKVELLIAPKSGSFPLPCCSARLIFKVVDIADSWFVKIAIG